MFEMREVVVSRGQVVLDMVELFFVCQHRVRVGVGHVRFNRHDASGVRITHVNAPELTSKHTSYHHE